MRLVSSNLASYHATVQKVLIRQVLTRSFACAFLTHATSHSCVPGAGGGVNRILGARGRSSEVRPQTFGMGTHGTRK